MIFHPENVPVGQDQLEFSWFSFSTRYNTFIGESNAKYGKRPWEFTVIQTLTNFKSTDIVLDVGGAQSFIGPFIVDSINRFYVVDNFQFPNSLEWYATLFPFPQFVSGKVIVISENGIDMPFRDNYFDYVISVSALEHFENNDDILASAEIYRVLKPGGWFLGTVDFNLLSENPLVTQGNSSYFHGKCYTYESFFSRIVSSAPWKLHGAERRIPIDKWLEYNAVQIALFFVLVK